MQQNRLSRITNFIRGIADDVPRDMPHTRVAPVRVNTGYEISRTRYFYKPQPLRSLAEIRADILALEGETEGLLESILVAGVQASSDRHDER